MSQRKPNHLRLGLTGGIGSGKTTVCNFFAEYGITIVDADIIAREIVQPGQIAYQEIVDTFSAEAVLDEAQCIDRKKLRSIVFNDPIKLEQLEKITHSRIIERMREQVAKSQSAYTILCIPLLFEKKLTNEVDRILVVDIETELQIKRVAARDGNSMEQVKAIMNHQVSRKQRNALANDIIVNDGSVTALKHQVAKLHKQYLSTQA